MQRTAEPSCPRSTPERGAGFEVRPLGLVNWEDLCAAGTSIDAIARCKLDYYI